MERIEVLQLLGDLDNAEAQKEFIQMKKREAIDSVITPEIKSELEGIDMEFSEDLEIAEELVKDRRQAVKQAVVEYGKKVADDHYTVSHSEGRVTYDNKGIDSYIAEVEGKYPDVARTLRSYRNQGDPYASIRKRG